MLVRDLQGQESGCVCCLFLWVGRPHQGWSGRRGADLPLQRRPCMMDPIEMAPLSLLPNARAACNRKPLERADARIVCRSEVRVYVQAAQKNTFLGSLSVFLPIGNRGTFFFAACLANPELRLKQLRAPRDRPRHARHATEVLFLLRYSSVPAAGAGPPWLLRLLRARSKGSRRHAAPGVGISDRDIVSI